MGVRARGHGEGASRLIRLSVNVNKVATIRNSRGGSYPDPLEAAKVVVEAGAPGVTVHPREDERHIRPDDVRAIAKMLAPFKGRVEFNIEGDPRAGLISLVREVRPDQCTLVPVRPGEVTSQAGWPPDTPRGPLSKVIGAFHDLGVRVSLFVDPEPDPIRWAADLGADRIELYTEPYARAWERGPDAARASFDRYGSAATLAHDLGLGVNAGHDLDLDNLTLFRSLPHLDEVSIGHAIIGRAVFLGLGTVVGEYLSVLAAT